MTKIVRIFEEDYVILLKFKQTLERDQSKTVDFAEALHECLNLVQPLKERLK